MFWLELSSFRELHGAGMQCCPVCLFESSYFGLGTINLHFCSNVLRSEKVIKGERNTHGEGDRDWGKKMQPALSNR